MHYINANLDHPQDHCEFGEHGWMNEDVNVLTAIMNYTKAVMDGEGDIPLRFLVHFMGDLHQPLHLTGRDMGGNGGECSRVAFRSTSWQNASAIFKLEGHARNLHSVWDSGIITKNIRELGNYTSPVPSKQIEDNLLGAIFDPYVRFIVWEGIRQWWIDDLANWLACPPTGDPYPHSSNSDVPASSPAFMHTFKSASSFVMALLPPTWSTYVSLAAPIPLTETHNFQAQMLASTPQSLDGQNFTFPACPYTWATPMHDINCALAWPAEYNGSHDALIELDTDAYLGRIGREKTVEKLLAMAGLRLAKVVNEALGEAGEGSTFVDYWWNGCMSVFIPFLI